MKRDRMIMNAGIYRQTGEIPLIQPEDTGATRINETGITPSFPIFFILR
jgi:hypothetical protein